MGQCIAPKRSIDRMKFGDEIPPGTDEIPRVGTPSFEYSMTISNIKLRDVPYESVSGRVTVGQASQINLPKLQKSNSIEWLDQLQIQLSLTDYQLRASFLRLAVIQDEREVGHLSLNFYLISTGPYHHSFPIRYDNGTIGRISLDVRMSRIVELRIVPDIVSVQLLKEHPGEPFHFSLKTFTDQDIEMETEESYDSEAMFYSKKKQPDEFQNYISKSDSLTSQSTSKAEEQKKLKWTSQEALKLQYDGLPSIKSKYSASRLHNQTFQFLLWKLHEIKEDEDGQQEFMVDLYAQCYVSFNKLFAAEGINSDGCQQFERIVTVQEKIYSRGKYFGKLWMRIKVSVPKFSHQMVACLRSEKGIQLTCSLFTSPAEQTTANCKEIIQIIEIRQNLENTLHQINEYKKRKRLDYNMYILRRSLSTALLKLIPILGITGKNGIYTYRNEKDFIQGQKTLIDVGLHLLSYLQEEDNSIRESSWIALMALINRGEFDLALMAFTSEERQYVQRHNLSKDLDTKVQIQLKYQTFLYSTLKFVLQCLRKKAFLQSQKAFTELFCAYSYFRIPEFRQELLSILITNQDQVIEWKDFQFNFQGNVMMSLDWKINFYDPLKRFPQSQQNSTKLKSILENDEWKDRMSRKGIPFFSFLLHWINYVGKTSLLSKDVVWHCLPGYGTLVKALIYAMKSRELCEYPDILKELTIRMLANQNLLNVFIQILFSKTNLYNFGELIMTIELIDYYLEYFQRNKKKLPSTFAYQYFFEAIKIILESEQSYTIAKTLLLIYRFYNLFNHTFKRMITMYLLGRVFFKMCLHWAKNIRMVFHHLLVYRIYLMSNQLTKEQTPADTQINSINNEIRLRYKKVITLLRSAKEIKDQEHVNKLAFLFEKDFYRRMRNKLQFKIQRRNNKQASKYALYQLSPGVRQRCVSEEEFQQEYMGLKSTSSYKLEPEKLKRKVSFFQLDSIPELKLQRRNSKRRPPSPNTDFNIPEIEPKLLEYLDIAIRDFSELEEASKKNANLSQNPEAIPALQVKIPIDQGDIRPNNIDDW